MQFTKRRKINMISRVAVAIAVFSGTVAQAAEPDNKFLRFVEADGASQLQTSIVRYENANGVKVDLIGAVHIGDTAYFESLNERFKKYDALLYEMVKPKNADNADIQRASGKSTSWVSFIQRFMKEQLELDFQLDRVDYTPANFVHADLDVETFLARQEARGESMLKMMFDTMMREMNKPADERAKQAANSMGIMDLIEALQAPDRGRQLKLLLGKQFQDMDRALEAMGGPEGSVILDERNKKALEVLQTEIDGGKKTLGIFYGAAHMKGMDKILTTDMGFKQVGEIEWLVAWDIPATPRGPAKPIIPATRPAATESTPPATESAPATR